MTEIPQREIRILADPASVARRAAEMFVASVNEAVAKKGSFTVALAGGSTPKAMYALLSAEPYRSQVPWDKIQFFFGDERSVGPDSPDSNFRTANEGILSKVSLKPEQVARIKGENPDTAATALEYEQTVRNYFKLKDGEYPRFDLIFIGMGNEGHCLSLFPGTKALHANGRIVTRNWVGKLYTERITFTAETANNAAQIVFTVTGIDKACALKGVLEGPYEPEQLPSQLIQPKNGKLVWLVDTAAGSMLKTGIRE